MFLCTAKSSKIVMWYFRSKVVQQPLDGAASLKFSTPPHANVLESE
jgi:hypothetical protein